MGENDDAKAARSVKIHDTILSLVLELGGGMMPESGGGNTAVWSRLLRVSERSIERYVQKYKVPYRKPGEEMFIDAEDFRRHVPYINSDQPPEE